MVDQEHFKERILTDFGIKYDFCRERGKIKKYCESIEIFLY